MKFLYANVKEIKHGNQKKEKYQKKIFPRHIYIFLSILYLQRIECYLSHFVVSAFSQILNYSN